MRQILTLKLFQDGGRYHIETSPLICANQWIDFYMIMASAMKELNKQDLITQTVNFLEIWK